MTELPPKPDDPGRRRRSFIDKLRLPLAVMVGATGTAVAVDRLTDGGASQAALNSMGNRAANFLEITGEPHNNDSEYNVPYPETNGISLPPLQELGQYEFDQLTLQIEAEAATRAVDEIVSNWIIEPNYMQQIASQNGGSAIVFPQEGNHWTTARMYPDQEVVTITVTSNTSREPSWQIEDTIQIQINGQTRPPELGTVARNIKGETLSIRLRDRAEIQLDSLQEVFPSAGFGLINKDGIYYLVVSHISNDVSPVFDYFQIPLNLNAFPDDAKYIQIRFSEIVRLEGVGFRLTINSRDFVRGIFIDEIITISPLNNFPEPGDGQSRMRQPADSRSALAVFRDKERQQRQVAQGRGQATASRRT